MSGSEVAGTRAVRRVSFSIGMISAGIAALLLAGCGSAPKVSTKAKPSFINNETKFSSAEYGVAASPRVTTAKRPKKGGGRDMVGKPYKVRGKWYTPKEEPGYNKTGLASWYGPNFHGRLTANGEIYDQFHLSAAHPTFPLPSYARVTNKKNGHSVIVRVNDRGPYAHGRIIDLSAKAADMLDMKHDGVAAVRVEYVGRAPVEGDDTPYLVASYRRGDGGKGFPEGEIASGVMIAMNGPTPSAGLPGVGAQTASAIAPPAALGGGAAALAVATTKPVIAGASASAFATTAASGGNPDPAILPAGFILPEIGPLIPERPSFANTVATRQVPEGLTDYGLAFWGGRVTKRPATSAFDAVLNR